MRKLYEFGNSVCCQKVRIVLTEKGLDWESREVNLFRAEQYDPDYLKLNPAGVVPTLVDNEAVLIESSLICEYLNEAYPTPPLMPDCPVERAEARLWPKLVDEGVHAGIGALSFAAFFRDRMKNMPTDQVQKRFGNVGDPRRSAAMHSFYERGVESPLVGQAIYVFDDPAP